MHIRQLEAKLTAPGLELELPAPDEDTANVVVWDLPSTALADESSKPENIVVMRVGRMPWHLMSAQGITFLPTLHAVQFSRRAYI